MGELFKQKIITPNIMMYHIDKLSTKRVEEPLECLCILLKTVGKKLEQVKSLFILLCGLLLIHYSFKFKSPILFDKKIMGFFIPYGRYLLALCCRLFFILLTSYQDYMGIYYIIELGVSKCKHNTIIPFK